MAKKVNKKFLVVLTVVVVAGGVMAMAAKLILPRLFKKNPEILVAQSAELEKQGKIEDAINAYQLAVGADPTNLSRQVTLGDLYLRHVTLDRQYLSKAYMIWTGVLGTDPRYKPALQRSLDLQWSFVETGNAAPKSYTDARDAAAKLVEADPTDRQAAARLSSVEIRKASSRLPADEKRVKEDVKKLQDLAGRDPADADLPFWAMQGQMWLALQASRRGSGGLVEAQEALAPVEPAIEAMLKGQEKNPRMQWRVAQLYQQLAALEAEIGRAAEGEHDASEDASTQPATKPTTRDTRAARFAAIAKATSGAAAATQPVREPARRFTDRVTAAHEAALANAVPPADGKLGTPDYATILLDYASWQRQLGHAEKADDILERLAKQLPDEPLVLLSYAEAFRDNPDKRTRALELLSTPLKLEGLPGLEAVRRRNYQARIDYERITLRLMLLPTQTDPTKRKQEVESIAAEVKKFEADTSDQSISFFDVKGRLALAQGNVADGIKFLQIAVDRWPVSVDPRRRIGLEQTLAGAYSLAGQTGQAERLWGGLVERYPSYAPGRIPWIQALIADGQIEQAKDQLKLLKQLAPTLPEIAALTAGLEGGKSRDAFVGNLPEGTAEQRIRKAVALRAAGKADEAETMLEGVVTADPKQLTALNTLLQIYMAAGRRDDAIAAVDQAIKASPDNADLKTAADRLKLRTPEEFEKWQLAQLQQSSDPYAKSVGLADFYERKRAVAAAKGDQSAAKQFADEIEQNLSAAERLKPNDQTVMLLRFNSLVQQKRFDDADATLRRMADIAELAPNVPLMRFDLARARGDMAAAEQAARDITRDRPQFAVGWNYLGNVRFTQRRYEDAKAAFTAGLERQGKSREALVGLIRTSYAMENVADAKSYIQKAREALPDDTMFREFEFEYEFKYGNRDKVVADRERLYQTHPDDVGNTGALLDMYLGMLPGIGTPAAAEAANKALLQKAGKVSADAVKRWSTDVRFALADARLKLASGDFIGGEQVIKGFAEANPTWADAQLELATYYTLAGKPATAEEAFVKAVQGSNDNPAAKRRYVDFLLSLNRAEDAARQLEGVPGADVAGRRVEILAGAGKREEADKALLAAIAQYPGSADLSNLQMQNWIADGRLGDVQQAVAQRLAKDATDDNARYIGALAKVRQNPPDLTGAVADLTDVLTRNPKNSNAQALLAQARFAAGDVTGAMDDMDRAVQNAPLRAELRRQLIGWGITNNRWSLVTRLATEAAANPSLSRDPVWLRYLATAQAATGDLVGAERSVVQAESMTPKEQLADVQRERLEILNRARSYAKMLKLTDGMLAAGQKGYWVYAARGHAKFGLRDRGSAQEFDAALATLDPEKNVSEAQNVVNSIASTLGPAEAFKRIAKWEETSPRWRLLAASLAVLNRDNAGAVRHLEPLAAGAEGLPADVRQEFYNALGTAKMQTGDPAGAVDAYKKYLAEQPGSVPVLNNVAALLSEQMSPPKVGEAMEYAKKAYDVAHAWAAGPNRSAVYDTYGWILVQGGGKNLDEGIRVLQESVEEFPILEAHYHLAEAYLQKSPPKAEEAVDQLARGMELIERAKKSKQPFDTSYEAKIKDAQSRAVKLAAAAPSDGGR